MRRYFVFTRILVPLDGTPEGMAALTPAQTVATATEAVICLLMAIESDAAGADASRATADLEMVARDLRHQDRRVETCVRRGDPAIEIIVAAVELRSDLIVMTTHGRSGLARAFLGSVAQQVVATSPVPVLLLRPGGHLMTRLGVILVPVDGSLGGALALASAVPLARATGARVVLLDVAVPYVAYMTTSGSGFDDGALYLDENWDSEARAAANRYVSGMAARLLHDGIQAEGKVITGPVLQPSMSISETIMQTADDIDADLIVMSTHALTGPARAVLGSVADGVVRNGHRAVLLPRRGRPGDSTEAHAADRDTVSVAP
jgi:nucleotide-binding universal stress UspA family protein